MKLKQNEIAVAVVRGGMGRDYTATIKTGRGDTFKVSSTSAPWNALESAAQKWANAEMDRLIGTGKNDPARA